MANSIGAFYGTDSRNLGDDDIIQTFADDLDAFDNEAEVVKCRAQERYVIWERGKIF
ncbi:unannotated protein [freshwater metagenome]|uniref:Unannotated protein n=1 Tax=freshwater metagenome TaxID=449393 RepID=A0A6J7RVT1_9ZZZZ